MQRGGYGRRIAPSEPSPEPLHGSGVQNQWENQHLVHPGGALLGFKSWVLLGGGGAVLGQAQMRGGTNCPWVPSTVARNPSPKGWGIQGGGFLASAF